MNLADERASEEAGRIRVDTCSRAEESLKSSDRFQAL
jgi:hypothetical protein